jgi:biopolymer transport protein ExbB
MIHAIKAFALLGGDWVLYLLIALSVWSLTVIIERALVFRARAKEEELLGDKVPALIQKGQLREAQKLVEKAVSPEGVILRACLSHMNLGREALEQVLESAKIQEKMILEKNLLVLGTMGNNAPFIGLFGTVLGIIKAFSDLAIQGTSGSSVVMTGVSEALVSTAMGLLIAIPAVVSYNYFQGQIKRSLLNADRLCRLLLAHVPSKKR